MEISDSAAAILFLNPALCDVVASPQVGDIGLNEDSEIITHVYTYLGPQSRFEKAGPFADKPFQFVTKPSVADEFVHCHPMQDWVNQAMAQLPADLKLLDEKLSEIEALLDLRNGSRTSEKMRQAQVLIESLPDDSAFYKRMKTDLKNVPFPGFNGEYFGFVMRFPKQITSPRVFGYLWLGARLNRISEEIASYFHSSPS